jgi:hypothetical protein
LVDLWVLVSWPLDGFADATRSLALSAKHQVPMAFVTFALVGLSSAQNIVTCPVGSWGNPGAYVKVVYVAQSMKWQEAESYCVSEHNGHLISTHSIEENNCIAEKVLPPHVPGTGMWNQGWYEHVFVLDHSFLHSSFFIFFQDWSYRQPALFFCERQLRLDGRYGA